MSKVASGDCALSRNRRRLWMVKLPCPLSNNPKVPPTPAASKYFFRLASSFTLFCEQETKRTTSNMNAEADLDMRKICAKIAVGGEYLKLNMIRGLRRRFVYYWLIVLSYNRALDQYPCHAVKTLVDFLASNPGSISSSSSRPRIQA